ncbi:MAG: 4-vinyl reductase [Deltaproteobacteria bacterium]|nr:4-vinyl reductase [Candidatus Zymogenaceae bacterium]
MASPEKRLHWNKEKGSLHLVQDNTEHRLFLMRKGFMDSFFDEIENVEGKDALSMTIRKILEKAEAQSVETAKLTVDTLNRLKDDRLLPLAIGPDELPPMFTQTEGTRELVAFGSVVYLLEMAEILNVFKEVSAQILTPRGARAIMRTVGRRAGMAVGDAAKANYSWDNLDAATASMDQQTKFIFPLMGWGNPSVISAKGPDGNYLMLYRCHNTYEADGVRSTEPVCAVFASFLAGITESIVSTLTGQSAECREVKCAAAGDDYCAFAVKIKPKGSPALDWSEIADEWRALDT